MVERWAVVAATSGFARCLVVLSEVQLVSVTGIFGRAPPTRVAKAAVALLPYPEATAERDGALRRLALRER